MNIVIYLYICYIDKKNPKKRGFTLTSLNCKGGKSKSGGVYVLLVWVYRYICVDVKGLLRSKNTSSPFHGQPLPPMDLNYRGFSKNKDPLTSVIYHLRPLASRRLLTCYRIHRYQYRLSIHPYRIVLILVY